MINSEEVHLARYVQFRFVTSKAFIMVAEVEAHQAKIEAHTHTGGEWVEVQKPTTSKAGVSCKYCTFCGDVTETKEIPKLNIDSYGENLVLGKSYTRTALFASNGVEKYPDENGTSMTDGVFGPENATYSNEAFMAFYAKHSEYTENGYFHITFDLGKEFDLWRFVTYYAASSEKNKAAGVQEPASIGIYVSSDGENWTLAADAVPEEITDKGVSSTAILLDASVTARYVQFRYTHKNTFVMVSEAEVYGLEPTADTPSDDPSDNSTDESETDFSESDAFNDRSQAEVPADTGDGGSGVGIVLIVCACAVVAAVVIILIKRKK